MRPCRPRTSRSVALAVCGVALVGWGAQSAQAGPSASVAVLPVAAPRPLALRLDRALGGMLRRLGYAELLGPGEWLAQLEALPEVKAGVARARTQVEQAERAVENMEREAAVAAARAGLAELERVAGRYTAPELVARLHFASGLAELLLPADPDAARVAFRAAFDADATFQPDERRVAPRALKLWGETRAAGRGSSVPSATSVARLAQLTGVPRLVWLELAPTEAGWSAEARLYAPRAGATRALRRTLSGGAVERETAQLVAELLGPVERRLVGGMPPSPPVAPPSTAPAEAASRPWYRRWWVWTTVGVVLAGAGAGVAVALSRGGPSASPPTTPTGPFDFQFTFK